MSDHADTYRAIRMSSATAKEAELVSLPKTALTEDNQVRIKVEFSSLNFKDALGVTASGKIFRNFPIIPGIDLAGEVVEVGSAASVKVGDRVLVTGCGLGEVADGGYSEFATVPHHWVIPCGEDLSTREAMIYGTAGFTAGLCVHRLLQNDQSPDKGPIAVTGASGGVGSLAVAILAKLGFKVLAITSKEAEYSRLREIGAADVTSFGELSLGSRPLESAKFAGGIDNLGGEALAKLLSHCDLWGNIASVGLAASPKLEATVMPFILRGVSLLGISSANCPMPLRSHIWRKLAGDWKPENLDSFVSQVVHLDEVVDAAHSMMNRETTGRILVTLK